LREYRGNGACGKRACQESRKQRASRLPGVRLIVLGFPLKEQLTRRPQNSHNGFHPSRFCPNGTFFIDTPLSKTLEQRNLFHIRG
jgi:hypothetical protein